MKYNSTIVALLQYRLRLAPGKRRSSASIRHQPETPWWPVRVLRGIHHHFLSQLERVQFFIRAFCNTHVDPPCFSVMNCVRHVPRMAAIDAHMVVYLFRACLYGTYVDVRSRNTCCSESLPSVLESAPPPSARLVRTAPAAPYRAHVASKNPSVGVTGTVWPRSFLLSRPSGVGVAGGQPRPQERVSPP